jgi:glutamyl-tRNA reductase
VPTIATLREAVEDIRRGELERLSNRLSDLTAEQRAQVDMLTTSIVNKILHVPTVKMKEVAGRDQCYLYVDAVRTLFDLDADAAKDEATDDGAAGQHAEAAADGDERSAKTEDEPAAATGGTVHQLRGTGTEDV